MSDESCPYEAKVSSPVAFPEDAVLKSICTKEQLSALIHSTAPTNEFVNELRMSPTMKVVL
ncbi:MAG: hypothetical protein Q4B60_05280 [Erysipelotrichaceae bacterium]|nr:hypothetical protein [Erysipelotrichaceae bacterium]